MDCSTQNSDADAPVNYLSLFTIVGEDEGQVQTSAGGVFDTTRYSRFKYGDTRVARQYGQLLSGMILGCEGFQAAKSDPSQVIITASAYKSLPTAAQAVVDGSIKTLRACGYPVSDDNRIYRGNLTEGDYGAMSVAEREYWMNQNGLSVDVEKFTHRDIIVVDDVSISGAHGASVVKLLQSIDVRSITLLHVLKLAPELAARDPKIEDRMNHTVVRTMADLARLIRERPSWSPNARAVKFILSHSSFEARLLLQQLSPRVVDKIYSGILADGYDQMASYREVALDVCRYIEQRSMAESHLLMAN